VEAAAKQPEGSPSDTAAGVQSACRTAAMRVRVKGHKSRQTHLEGPRVDAESPTTVRLDDGPLLGWSSAGASCPPLASGRCRSCSVPFAAAESSVSSAMPWPKACRCCGEVVEISQPLLPFKAKTPNSMGAPRCCVATALAFPHVVLVRFLLELRLQAECQCGAAANQPLGSAIPKSIALKRCSCPSRHLGDTPAKDHLFRS
jgi:hypothetical protein